MSIRQEMLQREYAEVLSAFRTLTDIRFRLLAFLPIAAGAASLVVGSRTPNVSTLAFSLFGLVVTLGLVTYNARNDQLYDTLVARAASIERQLGDPDGAFSNRPRPWLELHAAGLTWKVDHRTGVAAIYLASIALWLFGVSDSALHIVYAAINSGSPAWWARICALAVAVVVTFLGSWAISTRKDSIAEELRLWARDAAAAAESIPLEQLAADDSASNVLTHFPGGRDGDRAALLARLRYLDRLPLEARGHFVSPSAGTWAAAQLVTYVADLAPEWVYDCATSRRRDVGGPSGPGVP
jgi:hypothetical protein